MWLFIRTRVSALTVSAWKNSTLMQENPLHRLLHKCAFMCVYTFAHTHSCTPALGHTLTLQGLGATAALLLLGTPYLTDKIWIGCLPCMSPEAFRMGGGEEQYQNASLPGLWWKCAGGGRGWGAGLCRQRCLQKRIHLLFAHLTKESGYLSGFSGPGSTASYLCEPR